MAKGERKGFVARWLEGKERSEEYARSTLPTSRWGLFWDILKGRFGRMVITNLLVFVTFLPLIAILVWRWLIVGTQGFSGPFGGESCRLVGRSRRFECRLAHCVENNRIYIRRDFRIGMPLDDFARGQL